MEVPTITSKELELLQKSRKDFLLLDVRDQWEINKYGAIAHSHNLSLRDFPQAFSLHTNVFFQKYGFLLDKDETIVCYCRSGSRSARATAQLIDKGYTAFNLKGGVIEWSKIDPKVKAH